MLAWLLELFWLYKISREVDAWLNGVVHGWLNFFLDRMLIVHILVLPLFALYFAVRYFKHNIFFEIVTSQLI